MTDKIREAAETIQRILLKINPHSPGCPCSKCGRRREEEIIRVKEIIQNAMVNIKTKEEDQNEHATNN